MLWITCQSSYWITSLGLRLVTHESGIKKNRIIWFERWWTHYSQLLDLIPHLWQSSVFIVVKFSPPFLSHILDYLDHRGKSLHGSFTQQVVSTQNNLTQAIHSSNRLLESKFRLELMKTLKDQEIFWSQHSRIDWLREGDKNTPFFVIERPRVVMLAIILMGFFIPKITGLLINWVQVLCC